VQCAVVCKSFSRPISRVPYSSHYCTTVMPIIGQNHKSTGHLLISLSRLNIFLFTHNSTYVPTIGRAMVLSRLSGHILYGSMCACAGRNYLVYYADFVKSCAAWKELFMLLRHTGSSNVHPLGRSSSYIHYVHSTTILQQYAYCSSRLCKEWV